MSVNRNPRAYDTARQVLLPVSGSKTTKIYVGDAIWWDRDNTLAKSAYDFPWQGSEAATQRAYARVHIGWALDMSETAETDPIRVAVDFVARVPATSGTFNPGDVITLEKASGVNFLDPQLVQSTTDRAAAIGHAVDREASAVTEITFKDDGFQNLFGAAGGGLLKDPGAGGAIPVNRGSGLVPIVTAGAEARSLADPAYVGQELILAMDTDGGDATITSASAFDEAGTTSIVLSDPGEMVMLKAIAVAGAAKWRVIGQDGVWVKLLPVAQPAHIADPAAMAAPTQDTLTDSTGGTPGTTLAAIAAAGTYADDDAAIRDAIASLAAQLAKVKTDIAAAKTAIDANNTAIDSILAQFATLGLHAAS